jgi:hypothetical protein
VGYFFLDANFKRVEAFKKLDIELNCYNLFNVNRYNIFSTATNQFTSSNYELRGRMLMLRAIFNF